MKNELTAQELAQKLAKIDAREPETPSKEDLDAFAEADAENPDDTITLDEYKALSEYSGKIMLRIPKELHRDLAEAAKKNGVSLNKYASYKLAK